jgi:hypothetical protein
MQGLSSMTRLVVAAKGGGVVLIIFIIDIYSKDVGYNLKESDAWDITTYSYIIRCFSDNGST